MVILLWIVFAMVVYDFSIHLVFLLGKQDFFLSRKLNYWPEWTKNGKVRYQQFWTVFWGVAAALLLVYLLTT